MWRGSGPPWSTQYNEPFGVLSSKHDSDFTVTFESIHGINYIPDRDSSESLAQNVSPGTFLRFLVDVNGQLAEVLLSPLFVKSVYQ